MHVFIKIRHTNGAGAINSDMLPRREDALTIIGCIQRRMSRLKDHAMPCPQCGYGLRASETGVCPECGTPFG